MQTLSANNPDGKAPVREPLDRPTDQDPDPHNPPLRAPPSDDDKRKGRIDVHGAAVNREDGATVEAAEGEIDSTPQGP
jgi:hypothetical protein